jgi:Glycosyl hydrolase family 3 N terminal domain
MPPTSNSARPPATASHFLLTTELRDRLGFKGVVISDYADVPALQTAYHIAPDLATAAADAINAGVDMAIEPFDSAGWDTRRRSAPPACRSRSTDTRGRAWRPHGVRHAPRLPAPGWAAPFRLGLRTSPAAL